MRGGGELSHWCGRSESRSCEFSLIFSARIDQTVRYLPVVCVSVCVYKTKGKDLQSCKCSNSNAWRRSPVDVL